MCGATYGEGARFCSKDGSRLVETEARGGARGDWRTATTGRGRRISAAHTAASAAAHELVGQTLDDRYRIVRKIGEGGMSFVYLAEDARGSGERYAVKVLMPTLSKDENAMARLRREAELGSRLEHPNICHIVGLGDTPRGQVYITMPFIEGEVLSDHTHRAGHLQLDEAARWVRDIAAGLHRAHELQIVHRDLKPENIMLTGENAQKRAVVMDFGLAKERRAGPELVKLTATGIVLGTPEFMSPEQLRGKPLDGRSDVYSLALMTYEMLTGKLPFQGRTQQEMMINRLRSEPIPIRQMRPELKLSEGIEYVLGKGMAREVTARYSTAIEFADAFGAAARGEAVGGGMLGRLFGR
jgi:serine/threonine-protein kinase